MTLYNISLQKPTLPKHWSEVEFVSCHRSHRPWALPNPKPAGLVDFSPKTDLNNSLPISVQQLLCEEFVEIYVTKKLNIEHNTKVLQNCFLGIHLENDHASNFMTLLWKLDIFCGLIICLFVNVLR